MPPGNRVGSGWRCPPESRVLAIQQSSMLTYRYPSWSRPFATMASAMPLISVSLMLQPNLFQLFQPMGGLALGVTGVDAAAGTAPRATPSRTVAAVVTTATRRAASRRRTARLGLGDPG